MKFTPPEPSGLSRTIYIRLQDGGERGPYHHTHIRDLLDVGKIEMPFDLRRESETDWTPANQHALGKIILSCRESLWLQDSSERERKLEAKAIPQNETGYEFLSSLDTLAINRQAEEKHVEYNPLFTSILKGILISVIYTGFGALLTWLTLPFPAKNAFLIGMGTGACFGLKVWRNNWDLIRRKV